MKKIKFWYLLQFQASEGMTHLIILLPDTRDVGVGVPASYSCSRIDNLVNSGGKNSLVFYRGLQSKCKFQTVFRHGCKNSVKHQTWFWGKPEHGLNLAVLSPPPPSMYFFFSSSLVWLCYSRWNCLSCEKAFSQGLVSICGCIVGNYSCLEPDLMYLQDCFDDSWRVLLFFSFRADEKGCIDNR